MITKTQTVYVRKNEKNSVVHILDRYKTNQEALEICQQFEQKHPGWVAFWVDEFEETLYPNAFPWPIK